MDKYQRNVHNSLMRKPKEVIGKPWTYSPETLHKLEQEKSQGTVPVRRDFKPKLKEKPFIPSGPRKGRYDAKVSSDRNLPAPFVAPTVNKGRKRKLPKLIIKASVELNTFGKRAFALKRLKKERFKI
ncbi:MAG: hypothetical protein ACRCVX_16005 [Shewanella sp.]